MSKLEITTETRNATIETQDGKHQADFEKHIEQLTELKLALDECPDECDGLSLRQIKAKAKVMADQLANDLGMLVKLTSAIMVAVLLCVASADAETIQSGVNTPEKPSTIQQGRPDTFKPGLNRWSNMDGTVGAVQDDSVGLGGSGFGSAAPGAGGGSGNGDRR